MIVEDDTIIKRFVISLECKFHVDAENDEEAIEKAKKEILSKIHKEKFFKKYLSVKSTIHLAVDDTHDSYVDDWDYDDLW